MRKVEKEIQGEQKGERKKKVQDIDKTVSGISRNFFEYLCYIYLFPFPWS